MNYIFFIFFIVFVSVAILYLRTFQLPAKIRKAEEHMERGEYDRMNEIIRAILDKKNNYVPARYLKAQMYMRQTQYLLAISELNAILAITDFQKFIKELDIHYHLAHLYGETKNFPKEIEEYKKILMFNPEDVKANHRLGHALFRKNEYRGARDHLQKVSTLDSRIMDIYLPLGISCFNLSDYSHAEQHLLKSTEVPGDSTEAHYYLGQIYKMKKDYDNAVKMLESSRKNNAYYLRSVYTLGEIFYEQEKYHEAIDILEGGLSRLGNDDEGNAYRYLLAECYEMENKIDEAIHHWEKISSINPNFRSTKMKIESYRDVLQNRSLMTLFNSSLEEIQPLITEIISGLHYNIVGKEKLSPNEFQYKAFNIKRINDPPMLILFNRTTREITEGQILEFSKYITEEKCKSGIYIATSRFSLRARNVAATKLIELYDAEFVSSAIEKASTRKKSAR